MNAKFLDNQLILPIKESFTNAHNQKDIVNNFSKVPFCLSYQNRPGSQAYGVIFEPSHAGKTSGTFDIAKVRRDTIFCRPTDEAPIKGGTWKYVAAGGSGAVVLTMPKGIDPRDYGINPENQATTQFAFVAPAKGDKVFRPGKFIEKGTTLTSKTYLFNTTAAEAIEKALR